VQAHRRAPGLASIALMTPVPDDPRRQLDFWIGRWECTWPGGAGTNEVTSICAGAVIHERFDSGELSGVSISIYDESIGRWVQTWMDSQGSWFHLTGSFEDGAMNLYTTAADEQGFRKRMRFDAITPDGFRWSWARSRDMLAWEPVWTIDYRRAEAATA
jgi:hypothetical protein